MDTKEILEFVEKWAKIVIPILSLIAGTGWIKYLLERRDRKRDRDVERKDKNQDRDRQSALEVLGVLNRIHNRFVQTQRISQEIMKELEVSYLEYSPGELRSRIENSRTLYTVEEFQKCFERMHNLNLEARDLYMDFPGTLNKGLRKELDNFVNHSDKWHGFWKDLRGEKAKVDERGYILADPFPREVVSVLEREIERLEKLV